MTNHSYAKAIFEEIQARPYGLSPKPGVPSNNCYYKAVELIQRLAVLGYAVRGVTTEVSWHTGNIPQKVVDLLPTSIPHTHIHVEAFIDGEWKTLDPSLQPSLEQYGFTIGSWKNGGICFPVIKHYSNEEAAAYMQQCACPEYQAHVFKICKSGWREIQKHFQQYT